MALMAEEGRGGGSSTTWSSKSRRIAVGSADLLAIQDDNSIRLRCLQSSYSAANRWLVKP